MTYVFIVTILITRYIPDILHMKSLQVSGFPFIAIITFLLLAMTQSNSLVLRFDAELDPSDSEVMIVSWEFSDMDQIDQSSISLKRITNKGSDSQQIAENEFERRNGVFVYRDIHLHKDGSIQTTSVKTVSYELSFRLNNGSLVTEQTSQQYTTNAARETWGSIKSMFQ